MSHIKENLYRWTLGLEYGWNLFWRNLEVWKNLQCSDYGKVHPRHWTAEQIAKNYLYWFWEDLNDGIE